MLVNFGEQRTGIYLKVPRVAKRTDLPACCKISFAVLSPKARRFASDLSAQIRNYTTSIS